MQNESPLKVTRDSGLPLRLRHPKYHLRYQISAQKGLLRGLHEPLIWVMKPTFSAFLQTYAVFGLPARGTLGSFEVLRSGNIGFPGAPDLALDGLIGRGSFGRVYKGCVLCAATLAAGVLTHTCQWQGDL